MSGIEYFLVFCLTYGIFMNIIENDVLISM